MKINAFLKFVAIAIAITLFFSSCGKNDGFDLNVGNPFSPCKIDSFDTKDSFDLAEPALDLEVKLTEEGAKSTQAPRKIIVKNNGGFIAKTEIRYTVAGTPKIKTINSLLLGEKKTRELPHNAKAIKITSWARVPIGTKSVPVMDDNSTETKGSTKTQFVLPMTWAVIGEEQIFLNSPGCNTFNVTLSGITTKRKCVIKGCGQTIFPN